MRKDYQIYKGLQRPLVFKMFKGRFIYWGVGSLVGGIIAGIIIAASISSLAGLIAMMLVSFPLLLITIEKQKKGLYDKKIDNSVFFISPRHHLRKTAVHEKQKKV